MKTKGILRLSIIFNAVLLAAGTFYLSKKANKGTNKTSTYSYYQNVQYKEQVDFQSVYASKGKVVMLGNSMFSRVQWNELLGRSDIINRGIGSDLTEGFLQRVKYVLKPCPSICFVEGGINDLAQGISADTIIRHLDALISVLTTNGVKPVLHTVLNVAAHYPNFENLNRKINLLNPRIRQLTTRRNVILLDLNPSLASNGVLSIKYAQEDGIHLRSNAYLIWKKEIKRILDLYKL